MKGRLGALALLILVAVCAGAAQTSKGHAVLSDMGLFETPASYTELSFANAGSLPVYVSKEKSSLPVSFTIHNVSGSADDYQWSISTIPHTGTKQMVGKTQLNASGSVTVPQQGQTTVSKKITLSCPSGRDQVLVTLAGTGESINLWLTCPGGSLYPPNPPATKSPAATSTKSATKGNA